MDNALQAFAKEVLTFVPRANGDEYHEMKNELIAHMEDRAEALEAKGLTPEEAQSNAIAQMGDAKEIGQALNAELSLFWGWVGRLSAIMIAVVVFCSLLPLLGVGYQVFSNMDTRFFTDIHDFSVPTSQAALYEEARAESFQANGVTVVFHGYRVYQETECDYYLEVYTSAYANNPFHEVQGSVLNGFALDGRTAHNGGGSGSGGGYVTSDSYTIQKGDTDMVLSREKYGVTWETTITIDWEGTA